MTMSRRFGTSPRLLAAMCAITAVMLAATTVDLITFIVPAFSRTGMSGTWDPVKLAWLGLLCLLASLLCGWTAWRLLQPASRQSAIVERWSAVGSILWWGPVVLTLLVYYPLPYFNHHIDRFLLSLVLILLWAAWMLLHPASLERMVASRPFHWLRVIVINALIFLILAEAVMRLADPLLAQSGLFSATAHTPGGGIPGQVTDSSGMRTNSRGFRD